MKKYLSILFCVIAGAVASAQSVGVADWGRTPQGGAAKLITLKNSKGMTVKISDYGAIINSISVPDRNGKFADVVFGFDTCAEYAKSDYFGAVVGRYGNRIANGKFELDGKTYNLPKNNGKNSLHGGIIGFDKQVWKIEKSGTTPDSAYVELGHISPDGWQGFPGNLDVRVTYTLNNANELSVNYKATTDKPTVCNLTQHSYFNLFGAGRGNILNHEVTINADKFTPVDEGLIPTGELRAVKGTAFDFTRPKTVGSRIEAADEQLVLGGGYDHNWVLNKSDPKALTLAATAYEPISGRQMEVYTTEPGMQFYCGNFLRGVKGKAGNAYKFRYGMCFETQHFPDSPNQKNFPTTVVRPNEKYDTTTVFKFGVQ